MTRGLILILGWCLACVAAFAQDTPEARLRDMLRRTTADLRAAQDGQASLQALLDQEKQKNATLRQQLDELSAHPRETVKPALSNEEIARMEASARTLEAGLKQWQDAYQKAAELARGKDAESRAASARAAEAERQGAACSAANTKIAAVANDILHLYKSQSFRSLLLSSYEPLLGLKKVELENTIQDYEDKIAGGRYYPAQPAATPEPPK
jgi:hypothetical protein